MKLLKFTELNLHLNNNKFFHAHSFFANRNDNLNLHTYIHNWLLQPFSQAFGLAFHITHVVCVNFIRDWRNVRFNVDSGRQILEKLFSWQFILLSEFLPEIY